MTSLKETLAELSGLAPAIPDQVEKVRAAAATLQGQVGDLIADFSKRSEAAAAIAADLSSALETLRGDAGSHAALIEQAVADDETSAQETRTGLEQRQAELADAADEAEHEASELSSQLAAAAARGRESGQEASSALEALEQGAQDGQQGAEEAAGATLAAGTRLAEAAAEVGGDLADACEALNARSDALLAQGRERLERLLGHVKSLVAGHAGVLDDEGAHLEARCAALAADLADRLEALARDATEAAARVTAALDEARREMEEAARSCAGAREAMAAEAEELADALEPLPAGVAAVKAAAERVGLSWS